MRPNKKKEAHLIAARLREVLDYNQRTGLFTWRVASNGRVSAGSIAGHILRTGYRTIGVDRNHYMAHRLAWLFVTGHWPEGELDHRDGNKDNNRFANLRLATRSQNVANVGLRADNTSGVKGVFRHHDGRWRAQITIHQKRKELGLFETLEVAKAARLAAAEAFGEFARAE